MAHDRRKFLKAAGAGALLAAFPPSIQRALAIPARRRTGTIQDIEHIVFLMQENRSFDHYFGTLRGVRGFGDPHPMRQPNGEPVWSQADGSNRVLPFHPDAPDLGLQFLVDLPHGWTDTHNAWNGGKYDQWIPNKGKPTMAYLTRNDIPFYYALADAFTVCDAYHCSFLGATDPNRYHMWTGWVGNDGKGGGPVVDNSEAGYDWHTFPERLAKAGISWKVYQDAGAGLDADHFWGWGEDAYIGNYGDNSLLYFHQYQNAAPGSPLYAGARTATNISQGGTLFDLFRADVASGKLPQVSWIVAPEAYSEHGNWPTNYGSWYISQMLDALTDHPDVWSKTAFFLMFDENDGFFDHMVPPTPATSRAQGLSTVPTTNELYAGNGSNYAPGPYGLGVRVPMIVISPWSKGGWVDSEVFDHTSLIQFVEQRFGQEHPEIVETNITPWRRAVTGDLTSAFDFKTPNATVVSLPNTDGYVPPDYDRHPDYVPTPPNAPAMPKQEAGMRPARAVPYVPSAVADIDTERGSVGIRFDNDGKSAAVFQVRAANGSAGPWTYTVGAGAHLTDSWDIKGAGQSSYDLAVHGPNGFFRSWKGSIADSSAANLEVRPDCGVDFGVTLDIKNVSNKPAKVSIYDAYGKRTITQLLPPHRSMVWHWPLESSSGWYDLTLRVDSDASFEQRLAGHLETGKDSQSDPALGV
jgi:phospholipase C